MSGRHVLAWVVVSLVLARSAIGDDAGLFSTRPSPKAPTMMEAWMAYYQQLTNLKQGKNLVPDPTKLPVLPDTKTSDPAKETAQSPETQAPSSKPKNMDTAPPPITPDKKDPSPKAVEPPSSTSNKPTSTRNNPKPSPKDDSEPPTQPADYKSKSSELDEAPPNDIDSPVVQGRRLPKERPPYAGCPNYEPPDPRPPDLR